MRRGTADEPVYAVAQKLVEITNEDLAQFAHVHDANDRCLKNRFGPLCEWLTVEVVLFKPDGKYYTEEKWRVHKDTLGPYDVAGSSPDFRRIDGGPVLVPTQEPWGFPHLFPGERY